MIKSYCTGVIGATGAVGQELLSLIEKRNFPIKELTCFASPRSLNKNILFKGKEIPIQRLTENSFDEIDIAWFCAGSKISATFAPIALKKGCIIIDNSSYFRKHPDVPLVIPEINAHALKNHPGIIASPNCTTSIMLMALAPLHRECKIKRIVVATYQAASGAGQAAMKELEQETQAYLNKTTFERSVMPFPYAFNLFTHNSQLLDNGYVEEEMKMVHETHKILEDDSIRISATCVRVPILRAHSMALNVEFHSPLSKEKAYELLKKAPGITILEDRNQNRFPMPIDASAQDSVFCGRIREDSTQANTLELWVVGDQLLKGAALNAVQIAEALIKG